MNTAPENRTDGKMTRVMPVKRSIKRYSGTIFIILVVFLAMAGLLAMILLQWNSLNQPNRVLPASLLAVSTADYSGVRPTGQVHVIGMAIIGDMLKDQGGVQPGDLTLRLASITAMFLSPVPTATPVYPQNVVPSSTPLPTQENPPQPHATSTGIYHPTASQVAPTSNPPLVSPTLPGPTATPIVPVPTQTAAPNPQPTSTSAPNPPTAVPPTAVPPPPQSTAKPHPPHPTDKPHPPKPTKKPKK
jgi:hypothetical protein